MRILHVPHAYAGAGNTLLNVISELSACHARTGGESAVVLSDQRDAKVSTAENLLVDYSRYCPRQWFTRSELLADAAIGMVGGTRPYMGRVYRPAVEAAVEWRPDLILLYEGHAMASVASWRRALPAPVELWLYVHNAVSRSFRRREFGRLAGDLDGIVCCSDYMRGTVLPLLPDGAKPIRTVTNGVDLERFSPVDPPAKPTDALEVVFAGQVRPHKGPHLLLGAAGRARELTDRPLRFRVVGSADYDPAMPLTDYELSLRRLADDLHLDVDFVPFVDRTTLRDYYRRASVVCVPTTSPEPFGLVVLEAMACGTAVVASRVGGLPEAGGDAAVYVDVNDQESFARELVALAESPERVEHYAAAGRARALTRSWQSTYDGLLAGVA